MAIRVRFRMREYSSFFFAASRAVFLSFALITESDSIDSVSSMVCVGSVGSIFCVSSVGEVVAVVSVSSL
jgi:hypothetical protein